jgi:hypothetical protein
MRLGGPDLCAAAWSRPTPMWTLGPRRRPGGRWRLPVRSACGSRGVRPVVGPLACGGLVGARRVLAVATFVVGVRGALRLHGGTAGTVVLLLR